MKKCKTTILLAIASAFALNISYTIPEADPVGISSTILLALYKLINVFANDIHNEGWLITIEFLAFLFCYRELFVKERYEKTRGVRCLAAFFSVMYCAGQAYIFDNSLMAVLTSSMRFIKFIVQVIGFYGIFLAIITVFYTLLQADKDLKVKCKVAKLFEHFPFLSYFLLIMIVWFLNLILRFPGLMSYDNRNQLAYFYGYQTFSTVQPVFHTWLFGSVVNLGRLLGNANLGLFLFLLLQSTVLALVLAYSLYLMHKNSAPVWTRITTVGIYLLAPYYTSYIAFPIKDMMYVSFFVLMILLLMEFVQDKQQFFKSKVKLALLVLAGVFIILFRNNGIYVYIPVALLLLIRMVKQIEKNTWKQYIGYILILILPLALAGGITGLIKTSYHVQTNSSAELFSFTYQQIGRYVRDYPEDVSPQDQAAIAKVLDYEHLAQKYDELTADPIKSTFNGEATNIEVLGYLGAWFHCFLKHPICYVEATWNQNYYLFTPNVDNIIFNRDCYVGEEVVADSGMNEFVKFSVPAAMTGFDDILYYWYALLVSLPVIGLFSNVAFYMIIFCMLLLFMKNNHMKEERLVIFPLVLSVLIVIAAPQIQNQPRYIFPLIYAMPSLVAFLVVRRNNVN